MAQEGKTKKIFDGRYEILAIVGRGACSVVYHARHAAPPVSDVALKVLLNKKGERANTDRLRKEALAMVSSRHRYVIRLDDFHSVGELCYLSMEYAPESDLRKFAAHNNGKLDLAQAERFLLQSSEALGFIHRAGIIHRDIKPDNILVMNDTEIRLGDFGVAVLPGEESSLEELQRGVGTMDYMAPEVLDGSRYDQRSDVYALGVTFYELFAGKHPFAGSPLMEQLNVRQDSALTHLSSAAPAVPAYLANVIMRAMSYDSAQRYPTGREMLQAILVGKSEGDKEKSAARAAKPAPQPAQQTPAPKREQSAAPAATPKQPAPPVQTKPPAPPPAQPAAAAKTQPAPQQKKYTLAPLSQPKASEPRPQAPQKAPAAVVEKPIPAPVVAEQKSEIERETTAESKPIAEPKPAMKPLVQPPIQATQKIVETKPAEMEEPETEEPAPAPDEESAANKGLPGIGLKSTNKTLQPPATNAAPGLRFKDGSRRETVSVPPSEVGATRELSSARPTVSIPGEKRSGGLAAAAMMGAGDEDSEMDEQGTQAGIAGNTVVKSERSVPEQMSANQDAIQGIQGKFKKVQNGARAKPMEVAKAKQRSTMPSSQGADMGSGKRKGFFLSLIILALGAAGYYYYNNFTTTAAPIAAHNNDKHPGATAAAASGADTAPAGVPLVSDTDLHFPNLPAGLYSGKITGFVPGRDFALAILSIPDENSLAFMIAAPGWTPTLTRIPDTASDAEPRVKVTSNGIILEFTGQALDGGLTGFFRNVDTGEQGSWTAAPVRKGGA